MYNQSSFLPSYKVVFYRNHPQTGYYTKTAKQPDTTPVMRLPYELKIEPTQLHQIKCNAKKIIRGKEKFKGKDSYKFFTGLQETDFLQWYSGNYYEYIQGVKIQSLCLFHITNDNDQLTVFYFGRFYKDSPTDRERFTNSAIPVLLKQYFI